MTAFFSIILSCYCLLLLIFLFGWVRIRRQVVPIAGATTPGISIVIAVRNEEENLEALLSSLLTIAYPIEQHEVVIVDDHSTDQTYNKIKSRLGDILNVRLFQLPTGAEGKKAALSLGISQTTFDIIATTDADCIISKNCLRCISFYFADERNKMVVGAVKLIANHSFFSRLQVTEFTSLTGSSAAAIGLGHPVMCNGANLAFRKAVFNAVKGYEGNFQIASGDDEFLMRKVLKQYPGSIRFLNFYEGVVSSRPQKTIKDFYFQRLRWAGKWRHNSDPLTQLLAVFVFVSQLSFVGLILQSILAPGPMLGIVLGKLFLEGVFLLWVGRFLDRRFDFIAFIGLQLAYPIYVIVISVSSLITAYEWKGRNYK